MTENSLLHIGDISRAFQSEDPAAAGEIDRDEMRKAIQEDVTKSLRPTNLLLENIMEMIAKIADGRNAKGGHNTENRSPAALKFLADLRDLRFLRFRGLKNRYPAVILAASAAMQTESTAIATRLYDGMVMVES